MRSEFDALFGDTETSGSRQQQPTLTIFESHVFGNIFEINLLAHIDDVVAWLEEAELVAESQVHATEPEVQREYDQDVLRTMSTVLSVVECC
jgi:hypothetical protein